MCISETGSTDSLCERSPRWFRDRTAYRLLGLLGQAFGLLFEYSHLMGMNIF